MQRTTELKITSMMITLENINDNLRRANDILESISNKLGSLETKNEITIRHIIAFEETNKGED